MSIDSFMVTNSIIIWNDYIKENNDYNDFINSNNSLFNVF